MAQFELNVRVNGVEQAVTTVGGLEQALAATNQQLSQVEENSRDFTFLQNQANNLQTVFQAVTGDTAKFNQELENVNQSAEKLGTTLTSGTDVSRQLRDAGENAEDLGREINNTVRNSTSLRAELRKIVVELQNLEPGSARFQTLSQRAGELKEQIGDTQAVVNALAGSTAERLGRALGSSVQIGIAGFQAITAGAALFGVEAENLQPILVKLTALLNLSQAVETFGTLPDKINEITAGFQSLTQATEATTAATEAGNTANSANALSQNAANVATNEGAIANRQNAAANKDDAASSLADAAAKGAEAAATTAATTATTALSLAMKALPIIGIVAAIGTLVFSLFQLTGANKDAAKEEALRQKQLEAKKKREEEYADTIAKESQEFVSLAFQLRQTNPLSKERDKLLKTINTTYGSTLKNLSDEQLFQEQINSTIKDYIALQTIKYKLTQNEDVFQKSIAKSVDAERKLAEIQRQVNGNYALTEDARKAALGDYQAEIRFRNELGKKYKDFNLDRTIELQTLKDIQAQVKSAQNQYTTSQSTLERLTKQRSRLLKEERDYLDELFPKRDEKTKKDKKEIEDVKSLTAAEQFALEILREKRALEDEIATNRAKNTTSLVDDLETEKQIQIASLRERADEALKLDKEEVDSKKKKASESVKIEELFDQQRTAINVEYDSRIKRQSEQEVLDRKAINDQLLLEYQILQNEIKFGDNDTLDSKKALAQQERQLLIDSKDAELRNQNLTFEQYQTLLIERQQLYEAWAFNQEQIDIEVAAESAKRDLANYRQILEERLGIKINYTLRGISAEGKLEEDALNEFKQREDEKEDIYLERLRTQLLEAGILEAQKTGEDEKTFNERTKLGVTAFRNLLQTNENLLLQFSTTEKQINADTNEAIAQNDKETTEKTFEARLGILREFFSLVSDSLNQFGVETLAGYTNLVSGAVTATQEIFRILNEDFDTITERIAAIANVVGSLLNSVIQGFVDQNQAALEEDLQNFERVSNARKDQLANEYNSGLITRQQYDAGVQAADKKLQDEQLKAKKKAFEQDKKLRIAQATISGLQGAVAAFAGAMQLGPIAGPIVGAVLAAAVAALTAVQINQIKKQQFDSGGTTVQLNESVTSNATSAVAEASAGGFTGFNENLTGTPQNAGGNMTPSGATFQKVYVVESDITSTQNRVRVLENNASFG